MFTEQNELHRFNRGILCFLLAIAYYLICRIRIKDYLFFNLRRRFKACSKDPYEICQKSNSKQKSCNT